MKVDSISELAQLNSNKTHRTSFEIQQRAYILDSVLSLALIGLHTVWALLYNGTEDYTWWIITTFLVLIVLAVSTMAIQKSIFMIRNFFSCVSMAWLIYRTMILSSCMQFNIFLFGIYSQAVYREFCYSDNEINLVTFAVYFCGVLYVYNVTAGFWIIWKSFGARSKICGELAVIVDTDVSYF